MMDTTEPTQLAAAVEEWWGDDLSAETIDRIAEAPIEHWVAFGEQYATQRRSGVAATGRYEQRFEPGLALENCA